jgi:hypothetical protein
MIPIKDDVNRIRTDNTMKKRKNTNNDLQNTTQKTKNSAIYLNKTYT